MAEGTKRVVGNITKLRNKVFVGDAESKRLDNVACGRRNAPTRPRVTGMRVAPSYM